MPANVKELKLVSTGPAPGGTGRVINRYLHATNDAAAVVEAAGYFNGVLNNGLGKGDIIESVMTVSGTPTGKTYLVTAGGAAVTIVAV